MRKSMLIAMLSLLGIACFGLSSNTNSSLFTLDTAAPQISILAPTGGEQWYIGDSNDILWEATDTNLSSDSIYLWYSLNGGSNYLSLAEAISNSGSYAWQMPDTQSYYAKLKIQATDDFGNVAEKASLAAFAITYVPPQQPQDLDVDISNNTDAIITWQPVTETVYNTPITPDGYMVLYNETPYEDEQFYYYLGETTAVTSFTHHNVARRRDQMYYRVVAFKDFEGRLANILAAAKADPDARLSLADIKQAMKNPTIGGMK